jgi:hypothetical protein
MTVRRFTTLALWLSSLAYSARYKRVGRQYLDGAISAIADEEGAEVVMSGRLPGIR